MGQLLRSVVRSVSQRGGRGSRELYKLARRYSLLYENFNYNARTNGEYWLVSRLTQFDLQTIFDVGANRGDWSEHCAKLFPAARIHSFEIVPDTAEKLEARTDGTSNVIVNRFGLSDSSGNVSIFV